MIKPSTLLILLSTIATTAMAEDTQPFSAEAEFGAILTSGNTESTAIKGKLDIEQDLSTWRTNYVVEALYKEDQVEIIDNGVSTKEDQTTAEKYFLSAQGDYKLNEEYRGLFIFGSYEEDKFSGYEYQSTIAGGYSDRLFKTDKSELNYSIGPGYSFYKTEEEVDDNDVLIPSESESSFIVRVDLNFQYDFSENAKFTQSLSTDHATDSEKNSKTRAESALTTKINDDFALKASYTVTHNSEVADDKENTDTQTALTLVYSF